MDNVIVYLLDSSEFILTEIYTKRTALIKRLRMLLGDDYCSYCRDLSLQKIVVGSHAVKHFLDLGDLSLQKITVPFYLNNDKRFKLLSLAYGIKILNIKMFLSLDDRLKYLNNYYDPWRCYKIGEQS